MAPKGLVLIFQNKKGSSKDTDSQYKDYYDLVWEVQSLKFVYIFCITCVLEIKESRF